MKSDVNKFYMIKLGLSSHGMYMNVHAGTGLKQRDISWLDSNTDQKLN